MLLNYLKIAFRQLWRNQLFSAVNVVGLAVGLAVSLLIGLFVAHEWSFDRFHPNADYIYRVHTKMQYSDYEFSSDKASARIGPDLQKRLPDVLNFVRFFRNPDAPFDVSPRRRFTQDGFALTDASFFQMFGFRLLQGNVRTVFRTPQSLVVAERVARQWFGTEDPIGRIVQYKSKLPFVITGVMADPPSNSTLQLDVLAPITSFRAVDQLRHSSAKRPDGQTELDFPGYSRGHFETYLLVKNAYTAGRIPALLHQMTLETGENGTQTDLFAFFVQPLTSIHFGANFGDMANVRLVSLFSLAAVLVLLLALVNYMSLTTARSAERGREVAVRKVAGASRKTLAGQFYMESALVTLISFGLALLLFSTLRVPFQNLIQSQIDNAFLSQPLFISVALGLMLLCVAVSGSYPALVLSAFAPAETLRGKFGLRVGSGRLRKAFTVLQFGASAGLIACSFIIYQQLQLLRTKDIGLQKAQVLAVPFAANLSARVATLQQQMTQLPGVGAVTVADLALFRRQPTTVGFTSPVNGRELSLGIINADVTFLDFFGIRWAVEPPADNRLGTKNTMILNESAAKLAGIYDQGVRWPLFGNPVEVLGITQDFNYASLRDRVEPVMLFVSRDSSATFYDLAGGCFYLRLTPGTNWRSTLNQIGKLCHRYDPESAFSYYFLDEAFDNFHRSESRLTNVFGLFTGIALFIAGLGLFGLAAFTAEQRTKEVGIRKVLGASVASIVALLSKDFLKLVLVAILLATPIAWYAMNQWLQDFAYKIDIEWWVFALAGLLATTVAVLTVSFQSIKAALMNPVKSLRTE